MHSKSELHESSHVSRPMMDYVEAVFSHDLRKFGGCPVGVGHPVRDTLVPHTVVS